MKKMRPITYLALAACLWGAAPAGAQTATRGMSVEDLAAWQRISARAISDDGQWVACKMEPWEGDATVLLYAKDGEENNRFTPARSFAFSASSKYLIVERTPQKAVLDSLKLRKTQKDKMPMNTLVIYSYMGKEETIDSLKTFKLAEEADWVAYQRGRKDSTLYVDDGKKPFKIGKPIMLQGKDGIEVDEMNPGYIGAVAKVDDIVYGSVLHDASIDGTIYMKKLNFPKPMFGLAVSPARRGDESRMSEVIDKMVSEDPTLAVEHDATMNETVLRGLSEQHLKLVLKRMASQYKLEIQTRTPRIPYRETISSSAEGHARHKKQTGGAGQFGEVYLRIDPLPRGAGFKFVDQVKGGAIPYNFIPAVEKGVKEVLDQGYIAGYPIYDVRVTVYDGKYHPVDSKEVAFVAAGRKAMLDALSRANPTLLEPIVRIEILAPDVYMGDIAGDLASRRGQVSGTENLTGGMMLITGRVPLTGLDGYANRLNALTQGAGSYSVELQAYEPVPASVQAELASHYQRKAEED